MSDFNFQKRNKLLGKVETKWFENEIPSDPASFEKLTNLEEIAKYRNLARQVYEQDIVNYNQFREKTRRSDHNWIKTVLTTGTTGDKISANCILIQDSAIHNLRNLDNLISLVKINKKRECMLAIDALKDLFITYILPERTLKNFNDNPFNNLNELSSGDKEKRDTILLVWYFEALLKSRYISFINAIQLVLHDQIAATKTKMISTIVDLLAASKVEQEKHLIEILINKLGDPDYQVASKVVHETKKILFKDEKKKLDLLYEVERLVCRQNIGEKAQYYGFCCMNQIVLTRKDNEVANRLLVVYFSFFKKYIKNKEVDNRMLGAILTGVNRAYKYAKMNHEEIDNNLNTLFKIVHVATFNVSIQALLLLNQVVDSRDDMTQRYYNALYRKLFDLESKNTSKQTYFLNLFFNSVNKDEAIARIKAFVKRLCQICLCQNVPFITGAFVMLSELFKTKKNILQFDPSLIIKNFRPANGKAIEAPMGSLDDDDEEKFVDVKSDSESDNEAGDKIDGPNGKKKDIKSNKKNSWVHKKNYNHKTRDSYDYTQRNPLFSGADKTLTYEMLLFQKHYHPSVSLFAKRLIHDESINYTGNPMDDFTLMHFLDRFVYKNPKKSKNEDAEKMKRSVFGVQKSSKNSTINQIPINSKEYLGLDYKSIPEEEKFFYQYFKKQSERRKDFNDDISEGSISDTEFDEFLFKSGNDGVSKDEDWDLDFADDISKGKKEGKKGKKKKAQDEDDMLAEFEDDDDDMDEDDMLAEFEDDEDFMKAMAEDAEGGEGESDGEETPNFNPKKKMKGDIGELFAAADEFSDILNESGKINSMGLGSVSNKDNADPKQLKWEINRNRDFSKRNSKKSNKSFSKAKAANDSKSKGKGKRPPKPMKFGKNKQKFAKKAVKRLKK